MRPMRLGKLVVVSMLLLGAAPRAASDWTPLWNGKDFDGWTTWMQSRRRRPTCRVWRKTPTATTPSRSGRDAIR